MDFVDVAKLFKTLLRLCYDVMIPELLIVRGQSEDKPQEISL